MMGWYALLFALVALIYAAVGFGGGSTYAALLGLWGLDYRLIPVVALLCNLIVVTGSAIRYQKAGLIGWRAFAPLLAVSAPMAFLGGIAQIKQQVFLAILAGALLLSSVLMIVEPKSWIPQRLPLSAVLLLSAGVGLLAGLSGIGGGIYMAPLLYLAGWNDSKRIAAFASIYILVNSIAGVAGQVAKPGSEEIFAQLDGYWTLFTAVLIGGQLGNIVGIKLLSADVLRIATAMLVGYVAITILWQLFA
jgi:hypothetical protein